MSVYNYSLENSLRQTSTPAKSTRDISTSVAVTKLAFTMYLDEN